MFYVTDGPGHPDVTNLGYVYVSVGSLTGDITEIATAHVSYEEKIAWHEVSDALPKFRGKTDLIE